jgi:hypothetical protein
MGKLLDYANLGMNMYQTKQLSTLSAAHESLATAHMIEGMTASNEVEKRQLMMQLESEIGALDFRQNEVGNAATLIRIRYATDSLDLTVSGFREFADMDRAKAFNDLLSEWESWMVENIALDTISNAKLLHQYLLEDDDFEEYAALQHVKEAEDKEKALKMRASGWAGLAIVVAALIAIGIGYVTGDPYALSVIDSKNPFVTEMSDLFFGLFCVGSPLLLIALWKPFGMDFDTAKALFTTDAIDDAKKVLHEGGGLEALEKHIAYFGEMTSEDAMAERMRRLEFIVGYIG